MRGIVPKSSQLCPCGREQQLLLMLLARLAFLSSFRAALAQTGAGLGKVSPFRAHETQPSACKGQRAPAQPQTHEEFQQPGLGGLCVFWFALRKIAL